MNADVRRRPPSDPPCTVIAASQPRPAPFQLGSSRPGSDEPPATARSGGRSPRGWSPISESCTRDVASCGNRNGCGLAQFALPDATSGSEESNANKPQDSTERVIQ